MEWNNRSYLNMKTSLAAPLKRKDTNLATSSSTFFGSIASFLDEDRFDLRSLVLADLEQSIIFMKGIHEFLNNILQVY